MLDQDIARKDRVDERYKLSAIDCVSHERPELPAGMLEAPLEQDLVQVDESGDAFMCSATSFMQPYDVVQRAEECRDCFAAFLLGHVDELL